MGRTLHNYTQISNNSRDAATFNYKSIVIY